MQRYLLPYVLTLLASLTCCTALYGQNGICAGSLGEPIFFEDFGSGTGLGPPLRSGATNYIYKGPGGDRSHPENGEYALSNNVNCGKNDWHFLPDHTPEDVNGYMLVVNASPEPGEFYRRSITGLCKNTIFEFSAWVTNANDDSTCAGNSVRPNILFLIETLEGVEVARRATGDIHPTRLPRWDKFGVTFNTGDETDFVLIMVNNASGRNCGNDLAIDDIAFRACGPTLLANVEGFTSNEVVYACSGAPFDLQSSIEAGFADPQYQWQVSTDDGNNWNDVPGQNNSTLTGLTADGPRSYRLATAADRDNFANPKCQVLSNPVILELVPPLTIEEGPGDLSVCLDETPFFEVQITPAYPAAVTYQWETAPSPAGPWTAVVSDPVNTPPGTPPNRFYPSTTTPGEYYYRCVLTSAAIGCDSLPSRAATLTVLEQIVTLELPVTELCADDVPLTLSGGLPLQGDLPEETGVYSGPGVSNGVFDPVEAGGPGTYEITYTLKNTSGCQYVDTDLITVYPAALAEAGPNKAMLDGTYTFLEGAGNGVTYSWSPAEGLDDPLSATPRASPAESTTYTLTVTTENGCTATDTMHLAVLEKMIVPTAFTPNADGMNDTWEIQGITDYPGATVTVFTRWGATVFQTKAYPEPWDGTLNGKPLPSGAYYYLITPGTLLPPVTGSITIIR